MGIGVLYAIISFATLPPILPVFNKMPWGYARLGQKVTLFIPVGLCLVIFIGNTTLATKLREKIPLLTRFLFITSLTVSIFTCIFLIKAIQVTH
ncbi:MAG: hypothetical protein ACREGI_01435 [Candidatus Levyibacteriota bacterium]